MQQRLSLIVGSLFAQGLACARVNVRLSCVHAKQTDRHVMLRANSILAKQTANFPSDLIISFATHSVFLFTRWLRHSLPY